MGDNRELQCIRLPSEVPGRFWIWTISIVLWASRSTSDLENFKSLGCLSQNPLHVDISWQKIVVLGCAWWRKSSLSLPCHTKDCRIPLRHFVASWSQCFALVRCLCSLNTGSGAGGARWVFRRGWCDFQATWEEPLVQNFIWSSRTFGGVLVFKNHQQLEGLGFTSAMSCLFGPLRLWCRASLFGPCSRSFEVQWREQKSRWLPPHQLFAPCHEGAKKWSYKLIMQAFCHFETCFIKGVLTKLAEESSQTALCDRVYRHRIPKKLATTAKNKEILTFSQFQNWGNLGPYIVLSMTDDTGTNIPSLGESNCVKIRRMILNGFKDVVESGGSWVGKCLHDSLHWGSIEVPFRGRYSNFCMAWGMGDLASPPAFWFCACLVKSAWRAHSPKRWGENSSLDPGSWIDL